MITFNWKLTPRYFPIIRLIFLLIVIPASSRALTRDEASHLLSRAAFGSTETMINKLLPLNHEQAVDQLLLQVFTVPQTPPPGWTDQPIPKNNKDRKAGPAKKKRRKKQRQRIRSLQTWWFEEMIHTDSPLTERMTLFWHNHFTSAIQKVRIPRLLYRQNLLLRRHAFGSFRNLVHAVSRDPAMVVYLDSQWNKKSHPNENFARELLELFTLGEGFYTEADVKEAARAFTGWQVNRKTGEFQFRPRLHDFGEKIFMGRRGRFDGDDIIDIVLDRPRTAIYITEKMWKEFISDTPDPDDVTRLARIFRTSDYSIRALVRALLLTADFWDTANRRALIKSPVELLVGTIRMYDIHVPKPEILPRISRRLDQDLFNPPNTPGY